MKWFLKLELKFGKFAIPGLMNYIVVLYGVGLALAYFRPMVYPMYLCLDPSLVLKGQVWRLATFLIDPPSDSYIFGILMCILYYSIGRSLEIVWGSFRFNFYYFSGVIGTILASFLVYLITGISSPTSASFITTSLFLAYALTFPENVFYLFFMIPVKAKYLAYFDIGYYLICIIFAILTMDFGTAVAIVVSLMNFGFFLFMTRGTFKGGKVKQAVRRAKFQSQVAKGMKGSPAAPGKRARHICHTCGITDIDDPSMSFRFCSKCEGNYEYCENHLYTHVHVLKEVTLPREEDRGSGSGRDSDTFREDPKEL